MASWYFVDSYLTFILIFILIVFIWLILISIVKTLFPEGKLLKFLEKIGEWLAYDLQLIPG